MNRPPPPSAIDQVKDVLAGKRRAIAKMMSRAETGSEDDQAVLAEIYRHTGRAHVIGLTGVPGSGKSTLLAALAKAYRADGRTIGIIAVDPSSPFSGGAILGDRLRMADLSGDDGVFIRTMATGGNLGGLARASMDMVDILDAAGFDVILIETVGVGQDEVDVVRSALSVVVLSAPGLGDEIQAIKSGILEIADIHVVSKSDRPDAEQTAADLKATVGLGRTSKGKSAWRVPVIATSAIDGTGISDLTKAIDAHYSHLIESGEIETRRRLIMEMRIVRYAENVLRLRLESGYNRMLSDTVDRVLAGELGPHGAARRLLDALIK